MHPSVEKYLRRSFEFFSKGEGEKQLKNIYNIEDPFKKYRKYISNAEVQLMKAEGWFNRNFDFTTQNERL